MPSELSFIDQFFYFIQVATFLAVSVLVLMFAIYYGFKSYIWYLRFKNRKRSLHDKVFLKIQIPEDNEIEPSMSEQMYSSMYGIRKGGFFESLKEHDHISFEIVANSNSIDFYAVCPKNLENLVEKQINAAYPDAEITKVDPWFLWSNDGQVEFSSLVLKKADYFPINTYEEMKVDSMAIITAALSKLHEGEGLAIQMIIRPAEDAWQSNGKAHIKKYFGDRNKVDKDGGGLKMSKIDEDYIQTIQDKISKIGFETVIRLVSVSNDEASAKANLSNLERAFGQFNNPTFNSLKKAPKRYEKFFVISFIARMFPVVDKIDLPFEIPHILKKEWFKGWSIFNT